MRFREAVYKAGIGKKPVFIVKDGPDNYSLHPVSIPKNAAMVHLVGALPVALNREHRDKMSKLLQDVVYGISVRLPGKGIIRRS